MGEFQFVLMMLFGILCMIIAQKKNRHMGFWFLIGFMTSIIGLIVIILLPDLSNKK